MSKCEFSNMRSTAQPPMGVPKPGLGQAQARLWRGKYILFFSAAHSLRECVSNFREK